MTFRWVYFNKQQMRYFFMISMVSNVWYTYWINTFHHIIHRLRKTEPQLLPIIYRRAVQVRWGCTWARYTSTSLKRCFEGFLSLLERSATSFTNTWELIHCCPDAFVVITCVFLFPKIEGIQLMMDSETGRSKGYGFISVIKASASRLTQRQCQQLLWL